MSREWTGLADLVSCRRFVRETAGGHPFGPSSPRAVPEGRRTIKWCQSQRLHNLSPSPHRQTPRDTRQAHERFPRDAPAGRKTSLIPAGGERFPHLFEEFRVTEPGEFAGFLDDLRWQLHVQRVHSEGLALGVR
jgi:hypothetical protein